MGAEPRGHSAERQRGRSVLKGRRAVGQAEGGAAGGGRGCEGHIKPSILDGREG